MAIQQMEDPTHLYYDSAEADEWANIKIASAEKRQQGLSKEQNRGMRDKIHNGKLSVSFSCRPQTSRVGKVYYRLTRSVVECHSCA